MLLENLPGSIGMWGETAAVLLFTCSLGLGLARLAHPAEGPRCTCSGGCGQTLQLGTAPLSAEPRCCCCDRRAQGSTAGQLPAVLLRCSEQQIRRQVPDCSQRMWAALGTKGPPLSHKHDLFICIQQNTTTMKQKGTNLPHKKKQFLCVLQANSCKFAPRQYLRPVQLWKMF